MEKLKQDDFYKQIIAVIGNNASAMDPEKMAFALYLQMKQYPENVKKDKAWGEMLKNIKILLSKHFEWGMRDIHQVFTKLQKLTQYMKKSA
jgi:hypothetical protein